MLERLVGPMARTAAALGQSPEIDRVFERPGLRILNSRSSRIVDHRMTDVAVVSYDLARLTNVLAIMTPKTAL